MYHLEAIVSMNKKAAAKQRRGHTRSNCDHSSYTGTIETGIILHSGAHRECRFLEGAAARGFVRDFLDIPSRCRKKADVLAARDRLIESYF